MPSSGRTRQSPAPEPGSYPTGDQCSGSPVQDRDNVENQPDGERGTASGKNAANRGSPPSGATVDEEGKAVQEERSAIAELEARLPRPDWYSSDDEESMQSSEEEKAVVSDLTVRPEGGMAALIVYTALVGICFIFNLASSCPVPWMRGKGPYKGRLFGVWRADKGGMPVLKVNDIHDCSQEMQYWQMASAASVIATVASFGALISAVLLCVGRGHMGASFVLSFYAMVFSLVAWAVVAHLYGYNCCNKYRYKDIARLDAGFALTLIAFVLMLTAIVVLGWHFTVYYTKSIRSGIARPMRFAYLALLIVVAVFDCVGPAYTQWSKSFALVDCKVTMWHIEVFDKQTGLSTYLGRKEYKCSTFTRRMKVVAAFNILGNIWLAFAILFATGACYNEKMKLASNFLGWSAAVFSLVAWLVLVISRHGHLCTSPVSPGASIWNDLGYNGIPTGVDNARISYEGYAMKEGFALMVTGWAINVVATFLNCIVG